MAAQCRRVSGVNSIALHQGAGRGSFALLLVVGSVVVVKSAQKVRACISMHGGAAWAYHEKWACPCMTGMGSGVVQKKSKKSMNMGAASMWAHRSRARRAAENRWLQECRGE